MTLLLLTMCESPKFALLPTTNVQGASRTWGKGRCMLLRVAAMLTLCACS